MASNNCAELILKQIKENPNSKLILSTGKTPIETYESLSEDYKKNKTDWSNVTTFNLDEYVGVEPSSIHSYHFYMKNHLFKNINISNTFIPLGNNDADKNAKDYQAEINKINKFDLALLGVGTNGHLGFNEPGSSFESEARVVDLTPETIAINSKTFNNDFPMPKKAITMGLDTIKKAKKIILIAFGKTKADAIYNLIKGEMSTKYPCTVLKNHTNLELFIDWELFKELDARN